MSQKLINNAIDHSWTILHHLLWATATANVHTSVLNKVVRDTRYLESYADVAIGRVRNVAEEIT